MMADLKTKMEEQIKLFEEWAMQNQIKNKNVGGKPDEYLEEAGEEQEAVTKVRRKRQKMKPIIGRGVAVQGEKKERGKQVGKEKFRGELDDEEKEIQELEQLLRCKVCLDHDSCIVFFPCRHMATCEYCESFLHYCPVCRSVIEEAVKIYEE